MGDLQVMPQPIFPSEAQFDLSCFLSENSRYIRLYFEFKRNQFSASEVERLLKEFQRLLSAIVESGGKFHTVKFSGNY